MPLKRIAEVTHGNSHLLHVVLAEVNTVGIGRNPVGIEQVFVIFVGQQPLIQLNDPF